MIQITPPHPLLQTIANALQSYSTTITNVNYFDCEYSQYIHIILPRHCPHTVLYIPRGNPQTILLSAASEPKSRTYSLADPNLIPKIKADLDQIKRQKRWKSTWK